MTTRIKAISYVVMSALAILPEAALAFWPVFLAVVGIVVSAVGAGIAIWQLLPDPNARVTVQVAADGTVKDPQTDVTHGRDDRIAAKRDSVVGHLNSRAVADLTLTNPVNHAPTWDTDGSEAVPNTARGGSARSLLTGEADGKVVVSRMMPALVAQEGTETTTLTFDFEFPPAQPTDADSIPFNLGFGDGDCVSSELSLDLGYDVPQAVGQTSYRWGFTAQPDCLLNNLKITDMRGLFSLGDLQTEGLRITRLDPPDATFLVPFDTEIDVSGSFKLLGQAIPEPATLALVAAGLAGLCHGRQRKS